MTIKGFCGIVLSAFAVFSGQSKALEHIELPPGFQIEVYASVPNARSLALGENGTVFVSNRRGGSVYAVVDDGQRTVRLLRGLNTPNGIAFHEGDLYVAEIDRVTRYSDIESHLEDVPDAEVLDIDLPGERHHGWRYIAFGPDGMLYISIGAPCNICDEAGYARIDRMQPDGSERETYAYGVRNSVGMTWHPETEELWFTDNGRDMLGDDIPADELNRAGEAALHFGYPYCHQGNLPDPKFGGKKRCSEFQPPVQNFGAHVASLGLKFYSGDMFPEAYRGQLFVAEHGSWNRSKKVGYRVSIVGLDGDNAVSYQPFASGWLQGQSVQGRPVDILTLDDGSMLVSDDHADVLYRISYSQIDD